MNKDEYKKLVKRHEPKENRIRNTITAFLVGGIICALAQILIDKTKMTPASHAGKHFS